MMNDEEILTQARMLRKEATKLLHKEGLLSILSSYGSTRVIGSYTLDTMTWRDIDISMILPDEQDVELFFEIGNRIATKFQITKMSYSNHFIRNFPGFDHGLYWGIILRYNEHDWKIDLWGYGESAYKAHMADFDVLHNQIQHADRTSLLRIKYAISQRPDYRGDVYNSMNVYKAVLTEKIKSVEEFYAWIERNSNANF